MRRIRSAIPVGTQFSPDLIHLSAFLDALSAHSGDKKALEAAVWEPPVRVARVRATPTKRRASLPLEAARQYGLLDDSYRATDLAKTLRAVPVEKQYGAFAEHILLNCGGLRVVEAAQQMALDEPSSGVRITGDSLAAYLSDQGFNVIVHNTAINSLRLWLERAGIFRRGTWMVDSAAKERLLKLSDDQIAAIVGFTDEQRAFLLALCRIDPTGAIHASLVRENAERTLAKRLGRSSLPKLMQPLKDAGFIDFSTGGTASGKSARVWVTPKFHSEVLGPFVERAISQLDTASTEYYRRDFADVSRDLDSKDTFVKGQALEAYAIQIMRRLGLRFVKWRERAKDSTGGAEVDAVMAGVLGGTPTRWQVQCKNTPSGEVRLDQVAKEVGLLPLSKATHILILANCRISTQARAYAIEIMRHSSVTIFLLDQSDFREIRESHGAALAGILSRKAADIAALKRPGLDWVGS